MMLTMMLCLQRRVTNSRQWYLGTSAGAPVASVHSLTRLAPIHSVSSSLLLTLTDHIYSNTDYSWHDASRGPSLKAYIFVKQCVDTMIFNAVEHKLVFVEVVRQVDESVLAVNSFMYVTYSSWKDNVILKKLCQQGASVISNIYNNFVYYK